MAALLACGCGSSSRQSTPAAQKLQREDLVTVSRALRSAQAPVAGAVATSKAVWPLIANGLPSDVLALAGSTQLAAATSRSEQLQLPAPFTEARARSLTGPASQLAGLYRSYALLSARGWKLLSAALAQIASGSPSTARFARQNAPLYIESIYDAHFTLAQIGKKLLASYQKLGGASAFGASLSQAEADALAQSYSEASDRLHPHDAVRLGS